MDTEFAKRGTDNICKPCRYAVTSAKNKKHRAKHTEARTAYQRVWRARKKAEKQGLLAAPDADPKP
jgi:hypothetical protein